MSSKREKGYWIKRTERFTSSEAARSRAGHLRSQEHVSHVKVQPGKEGFEVSYAVAEWYVTAMQQAGVRL
jgi:hypothetical protein